jgi:hypothetical protein
LIGYKEISVAEVLEKNQEGSYAHP